MNDGFRFRPEKETPRPKPQEKLGRRRFLRVAAGLAAAPFAGEALLRSEEFQGWNEDKTRGQRFYRWGSLSAGEREAKIADEIRRVGAFIKGPNGSRILESGTDDEIFALLTSLPPLLREHVQGTTYDVTKEKWPSVALHRSAMGRFTITPLRSGTSALGAVEGNGVFVTPNTLLTNLHVYDENFLWRATREQAGMVLGPPSLRDVSAEHGLDAVYIDIERRATENISNVPEVLTPANLSDSDVAGNLIRVAAIDPDESSAKDGTKLFPSLAVPVTKRMREFVEKTLRLPQTHRTYLENCMLYILPPGEARLRAAPPASGSRLLDVIQGTPPALTVSAKGTSGAPVMMGGVMVGINRSAASINHAGLTLDVGFFHGPDALRKAAELGMRVELPS